MKIKNEIKVGAVILVATGLLYFGLNYLKGSDVFMKTRYFYAFYDQIDGLTRDNVVLLNGAKVGRVSSAELLPGRGNKILVKMEILLPDLMLPDSTRAIIINQDVLGSKAINLEFPVSNGFHEDGDTLIAGIEKGISQVVEERLAPIQAKIEMLIGETQDLIAHVKITVSTINETIHGAETAINSVGHATVTIDTVISRSSAKIQAILGNVASITSSLKSNTENINNILANVATISDSLTRANYTGAIKNASNALQQFDSLISAINKGEGSLGMLINDDKLYNNLEQASLEIDKLAEDLRVNPSRYVNVSVFGTREKEQDKPKKKPRDVEGRSILP